MKTVKQKLEAQVKRIEDTFPQLITNQMYLGAKDHPDTKLYNETSSLVGWGTLSKWRKLKYILKVWNSLDLSKPNAVVLGVDTLLRDSGYYHLAKLLREEQKYINVWTKTEKKALKRLMYKWRMFKQIDPLQDKVGLIRALDLVHKEDRDIKLDILKQQYYYNNVNTNKKNNVRCKDTEK